MYFVVNQDILLVTSCVNTTKRPNNYTTKENLLYMFIHSTKQPFYGNYTCQPAL